MPDNIPGVYSCSECEWKFGNNIILFVFLIYIYMIYSESSPPNRSCNGYTSGMDTISLWSLHCWDGNRIRYSCNLYTVTISSITHYSILIYRIMYNCVMRVMRVFSCTPTRVMVIVKNTVNWKRSWTNVTQSIVGTMLILVGFYHLKINVYFIYYIFLFINEM